MLSQSRLQTIVLTAHIERAERFYTQVLGIQLRRRSNGNLVYDVNGSDLTIGAVASTHPSEHTVIGFAVDDLDAEMAELASRGIAWERFEGLHHDERGVVISPDGDRVVWFRDPDCNAISIVEFSR